MHIKALLVLLPLLLDPASSLAIPPAGDGLDSHGHRDGDIKDYFGNVPIHPVPGNRIENHVDPIKSEKIKDDFEIGPTLTARQPAKKETTKKQDKSTDPRKQDKPAGVKPPTEETQPQAESSETQPQRPNTRGRKKAEEDKQAAESKQAKEKPPTEDTKPQGSPSGSQPQPQPDSSAQETDARKTKPLALRPNPAPKTDTPGTQSEPGKSADQEGEQNDSPAGDKVDKGKGRAPADGDEQKKDDKGKGRAPADGDEQKKDDEGKGEAPAKGDEEKKDATEEEKKKYAGTMYHVVTPDPNTKKGEEDLDGTRSYYRKIGDGNPNGSRYGTHNPSFSGVQSHGQEPGVSKETADQTGQEQRFRPGEREERKTVGHKQKNENGESLSEWHKITPKPKDQLKDGQEPWTDEDLRKNLIAQQEPDAFPEHKSEDENSKYAKLDQKMREMCNTEQCKKLSVQRKIRRAIADEPLLRRRLESLLQERDHLFAMAMR